MTASQHLLSRLTRPRTTLPVSLKMPRTERAQKKVKNGVMVPKPFRDSSYGAQMAPRWRPDGASDAIPAASDWHVKHAFRVTWTY